MCGNYIQFISFISYKTCRTARTVGRMRSADRRERLIFVGFQKYEPTIMMHRTFLPETVSLLL